MSAVGIYINRVPSSTIRPWKSNNSRTQEASSIFHLVKIKDKQKLINLLTSKDETLDPQCKDQDGEIPLIIACKHKKWVNVFTLLDYYGEDAIPNFITKDGHNPLYYSISSANLIERLLTYKSVCEDIGRIYNCGNNILTYVLSKDNYSNINTIIDIMDINQLNHTTEDGQTALILCILAKKPQYDICRKLINKGVSLSFYDKYGMTALDYIMDDIKTTYTKEKLDICFMIIDRNNHSSDKILNEIKYYSSDDFKVVYDISIIHKNSYGLLKWAVEKSSGKHKIIKIYKSYEVSKIIPQDFIKETIYIKELNKVTSGVINFDGYYTDDKNNIHLVFEPLAITIDKYFLLISLYPDTPESIIMKKMRIETAYKQLESIINTIHEYGIVHNDIKTKNIMISYGGKVKLIDFGISNFIGFSPYKSAVKNYMSTSNIKAPDYGRPVQVNILEQINKNKKNKEYKAIRSFIFDSSRKSYSSDIYSFGVTIIQAILKRDDRFLVIDNIIYKIVHLKDSDKELNITRVSDQTVDKLRLYYFFNKLLVMININGNYRFQRTVITTLPSNVDLSSNDLVNRFFHYNTDELKNQKYEMIYAEKIFKNYKSIGIILNPSVNSIECNEIFNKLIKILDSKISIDTYYNALYNSINYQGSENTIVICISYFYIFSYIYEWEPVSIDFLCKKFKLESYIIIGSINTLMLSFLPSITIIPFVLLVQRMIILMQILNIHSSNINKTETEIFAYLEKYITSDLKLTRELFIWDFVQCYSVFLTNGLPFEPEYKSDSILEIFSKL
jgi:serine/threonine protein kinase